MDTVLSSDQDTTGWTQQQKTEMACRCAAVIFSVKSAEWKVFDITRRLGEPARP